MAWLVILVLCGAVVWLARELLKAQRDVELLREAHGIYRAARRIHDDTVTALNELSDEAWRSRADSSPSGLER